jgi:para-nitrobenzyl esterase
MVSGAMPPTVETACGEVRGLEDAGIRVFRGIPFARPPVDERRFHAPEPSEPWTGGRDATRFGAAAPQNKNALGPMLGLDIGATSENCLTLNVWTPATDGGRRPVMVWIHGGAFTIGAGSQSVYDGTALARRGDVVVVTINYRLGALGFLHLKSLCGDRFPATGNEGLLDQVTALTWVRDNIAGFGGDPGNVTIFGESAGSISVSALLGVPKARGLFHRAILQSGAPNVLASADEATRTARLFMRELGLPPEAPEPLADIPAGRLLEVQQKLFVLALKESRSARLGLPLVPVVDGEVIPEHPFDAVAAGAVRDVPILIGTTGDEMKLFAMMDPNLRTLDEDGLAKRLARVIGDHAPRAIDVYRRCRAARGESTTPMELWSAIQSDHVFRAPAMRLAGLQHTQQRHTFAYLFTWPSPFMEGALGACHAVDLPFVFGTLGDPAMAMFAGNGPEEQALSANVQDAWIAFARTGNPAHPGLPDWPAYDAVRRATMVLGRDCRVEHTPYEEERHFWEGVA